MRSSVTLLIAGVLASNVGAALGAAAQQGGAADPPAAQTDRGVVVGKRVGTVDEFLGIPYAAPPVGDLRFRPPQPHAPWPAPRQATDYGSICPQRAAEEGVTTMGHEDCLFLNVFTPNGRLEQRPVMVWIHGGGYNAGAGSEALYEPSAIVRAAGVVVVTLNYRLGILGFLAHPTLSAEDGRGISGNYGIEDQQAALAWTRRNIAAFGGDPSRVTVFGESAGGNSVLINLASPTASGLFQGAIAESPLFGVALLPLRVAAPLWGGSVSAALGCPPDDPGAAACLRSAPADELVTLSQNTRERPLGFVAPVIDGVVLKQPLREAFRAGAFNRMPVVIGSNHDEATLLTAVLYNLTQGPVTVEQYPQLLAERFGAHNGELVASAYPLARYPTPSQALAAAYTDAFFACPIERVRAALAFHVLTYGYEFTEPDPVATQGYPPTALGIEMLDSHTFELPYVFGHNGTEPLPDERARTLSETMVRYWTNFAKQGDPNGAGDRRGTMITGEGGQGSALPGLPSWPIYGADRPAVLSLMDDIQVGADFGSEHQCRFWDDVDPDGLYQPAQ
ncbi:MAG: carboxylesterase family protein [Acetobacteraceae bacterium]|nr:carboxylesterase family protein [Acetobacteraceae bacterium]